MTTEPQSLAEIRRAGLEALMQALGPVGMVRFLHQFEAGAGDYTNERHRWLDGITLSAAVTAITAGQNATERE